MPRGGTETKEGSSISEVTVFSFFESPSIWGIGLALIFGAFWLLLLAPLGWKRLPRWLIFLSGALIFIPSIALVQLPLQRGLSRFLVAFVGIQAYQRDILFLAIPAVMVSGIVQEAAKLIPIAVYWYIRKHSLMPRFGLCIGALAGAGYGVFEAQWLLNDIFAAGFNLSWVYTFGLIALGGFWERFFTVAFHTASGAVLGWGLAKGKWWLFYLLTSFWHFALNYTVVLYKTSILSNLQVYFLIAVFADVIFVFAFLLRWRNMPQTELEKMMVPLEIASVAETAPLQEAAQSRLETAAPGETPKQMEQAGESPAKTEEPLGTESTDTTEQP